MLLDIYCFKRLRDAMIPGIPGQGSPEAEAFSMGFSMAISTNP